MNGLESVPGEAITLAGPAAAQGVALLKLVLALGAVLLAFWVFARLVGRLDGRRVAAGGADLAVLGSVALGQRERLVVVRAGAERLVLGVTAHSIVRVHTLEGGGTDGAASAAARPSAPAVRDGQGLATGLPGAADFGARLRAALGRPE